MACVFVQAGVSISRPIRRYPFHQLLAALGACMGLCVLLLEVILVSYLESSLVCPTDPPVPSVIASRKHLLGKQHPGSDLNETTKAANSSWTTHTLEQISSAKTHQSFTLPWLHQVAAILVLGLLANIKSKTSQPSTTTKSSNTIGLWTNAAATAILAISVTINTLWLPKGATSHIHELAFAAATVAKLSVVVSAAAKVNRHTWVIIFMAPIAVLAMANPSSAQDMCWSRDLSFILAPYEQRLREVLSALAAFLLATFVALVGAHRQCPDDDHEGGGQWVLLQEYPLSSSEKKAAEELKDRREESQLESQGFSQPGSHKQHGKNRLIALFFAIMACSALQSTALDAIVHAARLPSQDPDLELMEWAKLNINQAYLFVLLKLFITLFSAIIIATCDRLHGVIKWILPLALVTGAGACSMGQSFWFLNLVKLDHDTLPVPSDTELFTMSVTSTLASSATIAFVLVTATIAAESRQATSLATLLVANATGNFVIQLAIQYFSASYLPTGVTTSEDLTKVFLTGHFVLGLLGVVMTLMPVPVAILMRKLRKNSLLEDVQ